MDKSDEYWEIKIGEYGACLKYGYQGGCVDRTPIPGHGPGGTLTLVPDEWLGMRADNAEVLGHELGHILTDRVCAGLGELCANQHGKQILREARARRRKP